MLSANQSLIKGRDKMRFLIFSDESGRWEEGNYYLRSWIRISPENYELVRKDIVFIKHIMNFKEVKWNSIKNNIEKIRSNIESLFGIEFILFITISKPDHFKKQVEDNRYIIIRTLKNLPLEQYTSREALGEIIKEKITDKAKHTLFFNIYEKRHIENSKVALVNNIDNTEYEYRVDSPQCYYTDWEKIAEECGIVKPKMVRKSEEDPGIELADIIAGCINNHLDGDEEASEFYSEYLKNKMLDMTSTAIPNPNRIFNEDFSPEEKRKTNIFR
jgi:hypothetical protein